MSNYFQANAYGAYGGYGGYANSGPPPPPGGYGGYGGYGGQPNYNYGMSSYNTGAYGAQGYYGGYQTGAAPPPGGQHGYSGGYGAGMVAGFTAPSFQACQSMYQGQPPSNFGQAPPSSQVDMLLQDMRSKQEFMQQQLLEHMKKEKKGKKKRRRRRRQRDEEEEEEDEEEEEEEEEEEGGGEDDRADFRAQMKEAFVNEMMRLQQVNGAFNMTSGTIFPFQIYGPADDDRVTAFLQEHDGSDIAGQPFDALHDATFYRHALKGWGTDDEGIIFMVTTRCNSQRVETCQTYKASYGRDLIEDIRGDTSFNFKATLMALFMPPDEFDAWCVKEAIYGLGTDERSLIEIFFTRTSAQIKEMVAKYPEVASPNSSASRKILEEDIEGDTSGYFKRILISAAQAGRKTIPRSRVEECTKERMVDGMGTGIFELDEKDLANQDMAERDAKKLFESGEDKWGTDEEEFIRIFATRDFIQLKATWDKYVKLCQRDILNSIDRETSGDFKNSLCAIVECIRCRPMYFAHRLEAAMKGLGTNDTDLIRIIVSRSEIDMVEIKTAFLGLTKQTLWKWLNDDTSGDYKQLLQAIVKRD